MTKVEKIVVRMARREDVPALVAFNLAIARETENRALNEDILTRGVTAVFDDPQKGFYLVAEDESEPAAARDKVVGGLLVTFEWSDWHDAHFWWIQSVYVLPGARQKGVYAAMHRFVESEAHKRQNVCGLRLYVDRDNERARVVYARLGMKHSRYEFYEVEF